MVVNKSWDLHIHMDNTFCAALFFNSDSNSKFDNIQDTMLTRCDQWPK